MFHLLVNLVAAAPLLDEPPMAPGGTEDSAGWTSFPPGLWRGVSIEKPTFFIGDHKEYRGVDWTGCEAAVARACSGAPGACEGLGAAAAETVASTARAGARAACFTAEALNRFPGMNVVRVPIGPGGTLDDSDHGFAPLLADPERARATLHALVDPIFAVAEAAEVDRGPIMVILDWHYVAAPVEDYEGYRDSTVAFWEMVASDTTLKERKHLVLELFNEPVQEPASQAWQDGMTKLYDIVTGMGRPVLIGAPGYSGRGATPYEVMNTADAVQVEHCYTNKWRCRPHKGDKEHEAKTPGAAVFATEVGDDDGGLEVIPKDDPTTSEHVEALLKEYEQEGRHGWVAWQFALPPQAHPSLLMRPPTGCLFTPRRKQKVQDLDLSTSGAIVAELLARPPAR